MTRNFGVAVSMKRPTNTPGVPGTQNFCNLPISHDASCRNFSNYAIYFSKKITVIHLPRFVNAIMPYYNTPVSNEIHTLDKDTHLYQPLEMQFYSGRRVSVRPRNKKTFSRRSFLNLSFAALVAAACGPYQIEPSSLSPRTLAYIDYVTKYEHVGPGDKASPFINFGVDKFERLDHSL